METAKGNEVSPIIRPGQRKPYIKGTQRQIDERRGFVARLLANGATKTEIHRAVRKRFDIEWRQADRYLAWLARARATTSSNLHCALTSRLSLIYGQATRPVNASPNQQWSCNPCH